MAFSLLSSQRTQQALDVAQEPAERRERYGMNLFGQATLAGRRLLEAGARLVSVCWDEYAPVNSAWDTHFNHFARLEDRAAAGPRPGRRALILDLESAACWTRRWCCASASTAARRRSPRPPAAAAAITGRRRIPVCSPAAAWPAATWSAAPIATAPRQESRPVSPKDMLATTYHLLGIDHQQTIPDQTGRPLALVPEQPGPNRTAGLNHALLRSLVPLPASIA